MAELVPDVAETAKGKIGKFPVWLIALVLVGGGFVVLKLYQSRAGGAVASPSGSETVDGSSGYATSGIPSDSGIGAGSSAGSDTAEAATGTNQAWLTRAVAGTSLNFGASPLSVYGILTKYVNGEDIPSSGSKYVDYAVTTYGQPPQGTNGASGIAADPGLDGSGRRPVEYVRERGTYNVYAVYADGTRYGPLTNQEYTNIGAPAAREVSPFAAGQFG